MSNACYAMEIILQTVSAVKFTKNFKPNYFPDFQPQPQTTRDNSNQPESSVQHMMKVFIEQMSNMMNLLTVIATKINA